MSSTTATPSAPHGPTPQNPPSLTERRKAETRMEIARAAAALFVRQGLRATRAEDIAQAAGVAPRTFYRYFASKEEAIAPLFATGAERWMEAVRAVPAGVPPGRALESAARHALTPGVGVSAGSWERMRSLIRLADTDPSLRRVWAEVCQASERRLAEVLAERTRADGGEGGGSRAAGGEAARGRPTDPADPVEVTDPTRVTDPTEPRGAAQPTDPTELPGPDREPTRHQRLRVEPVPRADLTGDQLSSRLDNVALDPRLRFAAAVAGAAVRTAVEGWVAGDAPSEGARGPAELAVRNLAALRDFPWRELTADS
ncbi:TetR/AcrR family transcriptional regulator [Streptomyces sp. NPDC005931]|uniref:TetR/AcrR family transcriptional regulator n=1 Tax=Streptomyces sp. NPDC005931 TaxID=3364737 RepID=UPI00367DE635